MVPGYFSVQPLTYLRVILEVTGSIQLGQIFGNLGVLVSQLVFQSCIMVNHTNEHEDLDPSSWLNVFWKWITASWMKPAPGTCDIGIGPLIIPSRSLGIRDDFYSIA